MLSRSHVTKSRQYDNLSEMPLTTYMSALLFHWHVISTRTEVQYSAPGVVTQHYAYGGTDIVAAGCLVLHYGIGHRTDAAGRAVIDCDRHAVRGLYVGMPVRAVPFAGGDRHVRCAGTACRR